MISIRDITIDAEFEGLIPAMSDDERLRLMTAIGRDGFRDPLVVWLNHGILLDGHNRYRIWEASFQDDENREPSIVEMKFEGRDDAMEWVIKNQLGRRNIVPAMRVALELKLKPIVMAKAKANMKAGGGDKTAGAGVFSGTTPIAPMKTRKQIAEAAGVSEATVHRVEKVLANASDSVKTAMLTGKAKITDAFETVNPTSPKTWTVETDIGLIRKLFDKLASNWTKPEERSAVKSFLGQLANEV